MGERHIFLHMETFSDFFELGSGDPYYIIEQCGLLFFSGFIGWSSSDVYFALLGLFEIGTIPSIITRESPSVNHHRHVNTDDYCRNLYGRLRGA